MKPVLHGFLVVALATVGCFKVIEDAPSNAPGESSSIADAGAGRADTQPVPDSAACACDAYNERCIDGRCQPQVVVYLMVSRHAVTACAERTPRPQKAVSTCAPSEDQIWVSAPAIGEVTLETGNGVSYELRPLDEKAQLATSEHL